MTLSLSSLVFSITKTFKYVYSSHKISCLLMQAFYHLEFFIIVLVVIQREKLQNCGELWLLTIRRDILFFIISRFHCTLQEQHKAGSSSPKSYHISPCGEHCGCGADCFIKRLNNTMASEQSSTVGKSLHDIPLTSRVA